MAEAPRSGSNVLFNPFQQAKNEGPQFADAGKRSPTEGLRQSDQNLDPNKDPSQNRSLVTGAEDDPNAIDPKTGKPKSAASDDPMLDFEKLWDDAPIDKDNPPAKFEGYLPKIDPKQFQDRVNTTDFARNIKPETLAKITKGDPEVGEALNEMINSIGRQAFSMSFNASSKMTQSGLDSAERRFMGELVPGIVNDRMLDDSLVSGNDLMRNPKFAPLVRSLKSQYQTKFPKATPQDITTAIGAYLEDMVGTVTKKKTKDSAVVDDNTKKLKQGDGSANWEEWLNPVI